MFAGVIHRDNGTPWPQFTMSTDVWMEHVAPEAVPIASLIATQPCVSIVHLDPSIRYAGRDPLPHVIRWNNALYLEDGHHRVIRAWMRRETSVLARVLDLDDHRYRMCRQGVEFAQS